MIKNKQTIKKAPHSPGVYLFKNKKGQVLVFEKFQGLAPNLVKSQTYLSTPLSFPVSGLNSIFVLYTSKAIKANFLAHAIRVD